LLLLFLAAVAAPVSSQAASVPSQTANPQNSLSRLTSEFDALNTNAARAGRRDLWLSLEERFAALAAQSQGDVKARAALYHARAREELARRSFSAADHREAVSRFAAAAKAHPKHAIAPESLFRQADILTRRLGDHAGAIAVLEKLIKDYPKAGNIAEAKNLLTQAKNPPQAQSRPQSQAGAPGSTQGQAQNKAQAPPAAKEPSTEEVMEQLGLTVKTIMIDAGHGGNDPGARAAGITEKQFSLAMARRVGALL